MVIAALGSTLLIGYKYSKTKGQAEEYKSQSEAKTKIIIALESAIKENDKLKEKVDKVNNATSSTELNELYKEILNLPKNPSA